MSPIPPQSRSVGPSTTGLTQVQVDHYLDHINLPYEVRRILAKGPKYEKALEAVTALQRHHLERVPFENLDLVYSKHHSLPADAAHVYEHVVTKKRGGVCDQIHQLFAKLLQHYGFPVYCTGARINAAAGILADPNMDKSTLNYSPWVHLNTIVTIGALQYIVDTSHGPSGSPTPVPLIHDQAEFDIWPRQRRLLHTPLPGWNPNHKYWRLQVKNSDLEGWLDVWAFTETEWLEFDFQMLRTAYSTLGTGWVAPRVVCFKTLFEENVPVGYLLMAEDELRRNYKGNTEVLQKFFSETERIAALEDEFSIVLTQEEQRGIIGMDAELKDDDFDYYA